MSERYDDIAEQLDSIAEHLASIAIDELKAALRQHASHRPASEKKLTQARRAVEKAAYLVRSLDREGSDAQHSDSEPFDHEVE